jgi:hypothetical protein
VRNEKTSKTVLKKITAQLKADNINNIFTIMNDVSTEENKYSKYYSKKYTYGYNSYGYMSGSKTNKKNDLSDKYFQYYEDDRDL